MAEAVATPPSAPAETEHQTSESPTAATARQNGGSAGGPAEIVLPFPSDYPLTDDLLEKLGDLSPQHLIERGPRGELIITPVARSGSGRITIEIGRQTGNWQIATGDEGEADDSSPGFAFNGDEEVRAADFSYFTAEQVQRMPGEGIEAGYPHEAPTFVVEIRSKSQSVPHQIDRCRMWIERGSAVAWMLDPFEERVHVLRADPSAAERTAAVVAVHDRPDAIEVGPEMPGLTITFERIWKR